MEIINRMNNKSVYALSAFIVVGLFMLVIFLLRSPEMLQENVLDASNVEGSLLAEANTESNMEANLNTGTVKSDVVENDEEKTRDIIDTESVTASSSVSSPDTNKLASQSISTEEKNVNEAVTFLSPNTDSIVEAPKTSSKTDTPNYPLPEMAESSTVSKALEEIVAQEKPAILITETFLSEAPKTIVHANLELDGKKVLFTFTTSEKPLLETFKLINPERVILDINGHWNIKIPKIISNFMLANIRVNAELQQTRVVFDMNIGVSNVDLEDLGDNTYQLTIR